MIRIFIKGQQLVLNRNTTMTVELNNALFASPDIEGDISFTFTLPVNGNEIALDFVHLIKTGGRKKLPCTVWCNNNQNWSGELVVQKAGHDSIFAALVINPYPEDFAGRKITENEDADIVISEHLETHDNAWEEFLKASVSDPDVKFAPFINEEGYGNDNENYGFWNGISRTKVVNSLFFTVTGSLLNTVSHPFSKAHNEMLDVRMIDSTENDGEPSYKEYTELNQLAFCPQIRIGRVLSIWCRNAGYKFIDHLGSDLSGTFLQSQKSLDATKSQYGIDTEMTIISHNGETDLPYVHEGKVWLPYAGWWDITLDCEYSTELPGMTNPYEFAVMHNHVTVALYTDDGNIYEEIFYTDGSRRLHANFHRNIPADVGISYKVTADFDHYEIQGQGGGYYSGPECRFTMQHVLACDMQMMFHVISIDQVQTGFNIFRNKFRIPELLPDVTNASFLKTMIETMGLCFFVSGKMKTIEIVPYRRLRNAKSLDLTSYELTRETEMQNADESMRTFRLKPLKDEDYNEKLRIDDVEIKLPDPYTNHEHYALRAKTNTLYRAAKQESAGENWVEGWEEYSGNPDKLETGSGKEESREPAVAIPHQRLFSTNRRHPDTDILTGETPQLMVADYTISSDLYNTSDKPTDIILTQYRGFRHRQYGASSTEIKNEVMLPVWADGFALKAKGANSLGEKYVKPVLELLGHKTVTYKFRIPSMMMQVVEDLLRPSELNPDMQTRFLVVQNVKTVPKKITFQIDNGLDDTVLCQIEAVKVY